MAEQADVGEHVVVEVEHAAWAGAERQVGEPARLEAAAVQQDGAAVDVAATAHAVEHAGGGDVHRRAGVVELCRHLERAASGDVQADQPGGRQRDVGDLVGAGTEHQRGAGGDGERAQRLDIEVARGVEDTRQLELQGAALGDADAAVVGELVLADQHICGDREVGVVGQAAGKGVAEDVRIGREGHRQARAERQPQRVAEIAHDQAGVGERFVVDGGEVDGIQRAWARAAAAEQGQAGIETQPVGDQLADLRHPLQCPRRHCERGFRGAGHQRAAGQHPGDGAGVAGARQQQRREAVVGAEVQRVAGVVERAGDQDRAAAGDDVGEGRTVQRDVDLQHRALGERDGAGAREGALQYLR